MINERRKTKWKYKWDGRQSRVAHALFLFLMLEAWLLTGVSLYFAFAFKSVFAFGVAIIISILSFKFTYTLMILRDTTRIEDKLNKLLKDRARLLEKTEELRKHNEAM